MKCPDVADAEAAAIAAKHPYKTKADLVEKAAIPLNLYRALRHQVAAKWRQP